MKQASRYTLFLMGIIIGAMNAMATEEAKYDVALKEDAYELRDYAPQILAEVIVDGDLEDAGNKAFGILFGYISGKNRSRAKIAMTAPVSQESRSQKIEMTAPVGQQRAPGGWAISFMMPALFTMETIPVPDDPRITLREVPARRVAAVRYSGFWSEKSYLRHKEELESWIRKKGLNIVGEPVWARYNAPFIPWFLRRNEILIPVSAGTGNK